MACAEGCPRVFYEEPAEKHILDGYARTLYDAAKKAVESRRGRQGECDRMSTFAAAKTDLAARKPFGYAQMSVPG